MLYIYNSIVFYDILMFYKQINDIVARLSTNLNQIAQNYKYTTFFSSAHPIELDLWLN